MFGERTAFNPNPYPWQCGLLAFFAFIAGLFVTANVFATSVANVEPRDAWQMIGHTTNVSPKWAFGIWVTEKKKCAYTPAQCPPEESAWLDEVNRKTIPYAAGTIILTFFLAVLGEGIRSGAMYRRPPKRKKSYIELHLGRSLGELKKRGHRTSVQPGVDLNLIDGDACQAIIVFGGIGAGKTSSMLNRLVSDILAQDTGVLFFDVKGDWGKTVTAIAQIHGRQLTRLGIGGVHFNLLHGLTPEIAASFLKSVMILSGQSSAGASVYIETAVNLAQAILGVLSFSPFYTLTALREIVFSAVKYRQAYDDYKVYVTTDADLDRYERYGDYLRIFQRFEDRIKNGALTTLSIILTSFNIPEIEAAFCATGENQIGMEELLNGRAFILDLPIAKYGFSAKTVYTMVKLRYFNVIDRRRSEPTWNQTRPIAFICDEYQEIVSVAKDAMSDLNFWDKARSARNIGIISGQGYTSFRAVIGDDDLTQAMFQNFRQKISFTHEDPPTRKLFQDILGQGLVLENQRSDTRGSTAAGYSRNTQRSKRLVEIDVVDEQLIRDMGRGKALAVLQIDGKSYDDVIETPYFEPQPVEMAVADRTPTGPRTLADAKKAKKKSA